MSYVSSDSDMSGPRHDHVWRVEDGSIYATVRLGGSTLYFSSAADARAVATECAKAAEAMDRLAAGAAAGSTT